ncbi:MAG TPA: molecular chaperone DnaJ [Euzebya sp.]|nr:molecular chaperone DnaJ [Euzebya sp.]
MSQADWLEKDFYAALGVSKDASQDEIRKAYRKLARENHPDANPDDPRAEGRFKTVSEAYGVLSDPAKRGEYDQIRQLAGSGGLGGGFRGFGGRGAPGGAGANIDLGDLLGSLFGDAAGGATRGGRRPAAGPRKGADLSAEVTLSFDDALAGVTVTLRLHSSAVCHVCKGLGARPGTLPERCSQCGGAGVVSDNQGLFGFSQPCPRCAGRGEVIADPCPNCGGQGVEDRPRTVKARLPAGVTDGQTVRLPGKGEPGRAGGKPGDLLVKVHVDAHEVLRRSGDNLVMTVPVTFAEAALGAKVTVPTPDGAVTVKIPAGTESGRTLRVRGRGAPKSGGGKGDLLVTVQVAVPQKLTKTQRKLVEEFAAMDDTDVRAHLHASIGRAEAS